MCAAILLAEDDRNQAEILRRYLVADGHQVAVAHDGQSTLDLARSHRPALIVLDLMMPRVDGLTVCRVLHEESSVLIVMLTARDAEDDLLTGLDAGADDYLTKPYSPRELTARIRTLLRRAGRPTRANGDLLRVGPIAIDPTRHTVALDEQPITCTPGEFAILAAMAAHPDRVFTRAQLLQHTRGVDRDSTERAIDSHVMNLRRKIEPNPGRPVHLRTVYGVGYKLSDD